jgi:hypothetical protein
MKRAYEVYGSVIVWAESPRDALRQAEAGQYDQVFWGQPAPARRLAFDKADAGESEDGR